MAATLRFTKMQGIGNDYVYVNGFEERVENPNDLAARSVTGTLVLVPTVLFLFCLPAHLTCACACSIQMVQRPKCAAMPFAAWANMFTTTAFLPRMLFALKPALVKKLFVCCLKAAKCAAQP